MHIEEVSHQIAKAGSTSTVRRIDANTVAYDQFIITDDAWNGCLKDTCVLCNIEFEESDLHAHKCLRKHVLNLLTSEVITFLGNTAIYRKIDAKTNHCLTCNKIIGVDLRNHFDGDEHKNAVTHNDENNGGFKADTLTNNGDAIPSPHKKNNSGGDEGHNKVLFGGTVNGDSKKDVERVKDDLKASSAVDENDFYLKNIVTRNYVTDYKGKKWCVLCNCFITNCQPDEHLRSEHHRNLIKLNEGKKENGQKANENPKSNMNTQNNIHMDLVNETDLKNNKKNVPFLSGMKSNGSERTTLFTNPVKMTTSDAKTEKPRTKGMKIQDFAKNHGFTRNLADNSYYCHTCDRRLPTKLSELKAHIENKTHIENIKIKTSKTDKKIVTKKPLLDVIEVSEFVQDKEELILIVNNKYWLNAFGFFLIAKFCVKIFCHACNIDLTTDNVLNHLIQDEHRDSVEKCLLITSLEDEFIREIKLDKYHCGYCNIVEEDWDDIVDHVALPEHKSNRLKAEEKLRNYGKMTRIREVLTMEDRNRLMLTFLSKINNDKRFK
ncbi:unnamed protein product [Spodoptera exigua]|nr:unnamed protein product [Spodoptera exigua]